MWERKELKRDAKQAVKANYWRCVLAAFLLTVFAGGINFARGETVTLNLGDAGRLGSTGTTNTEIVNDVAGQLFGQEGEIWQGFADVSEGSQGALAMLFNNATASGNFLFGFLNALNQMVFQDRVGAGIIIAVGALLTFFYYLLVENTMQVGNYRFYLENRRYTGTKVERLFFPYKVRRLWKTAWVMFLRAVVIVLGFLVVVPGFVLSYSYRMVPLILAENPEIPALEALRLSRRLMRKSKWRCFVLDLSFLGWFLLSAVTFHLLDVVYFAPYYTAVNAELYMRLRQGGALQTDTKGAQWLNDALLEGPDGQVAGGEYPADFYPLPERPAGRWVTTDYQRRYSLTDYVLLFFSFSIVGYLWEVGLWLLQTGELVNRGTMHGPWLPIYGCGGVAAVLLLKRFAGKPLKTFLLSMLLCGVIEYAAAWYLETYHHTKWWDYTGFFMNIQGRVCLEGLLVFGIGCCAGIYLIAPTLAGLYERMPPGLRAALCLALAAAFAADLAYSTLHPNLAAGEATDAAPESASAAQAGAESGAARASEELLPAGAGRLP